MQLNTKEHLLWINILIYGLALVCVIGVASILPVLPLIAQELHIPNEKLGLLIYSFTLPGIIFAPLGGILADRLGRKAVLIPCLVCFILGGLGASFATTLETLIAWRCIQGMGAACLGVLYTTIAGDIYTDNTSRLTIMAKAATVLSLGTAIFPALGGILGEISWQWSMRISLLGVPVLIVACITPLPPLMPSDLQSYAKNLKGILVQQKTISYLLLTFCAFSILYGPLVTYFPLFSDTVYHTSPATIGFIFALSSLGTVVATMLIPRISHKISTYTMIYIGIILYAISMLLLCFWSSTLTYFLLAIPILFYGLGQGFVYPAVMNSLSSLAPSEGRGIIMAANGTVLRLSQSVAPFICGYFFYGGGFMAVFSFGLGVSLCMLVLMQGLKTSGTKEHLDF